MTAHSWRYAFFLVALALMPALVQAVCGVALTGAYSAADGPFTVGALTQFGTEFFAGNWHPRWMWTGNSGLGSPLFYFYPAGAYLMSMPLYLGAPQLSPAAVIGIMEIIFRGLAAVTCGLWLRRRCGGPLGLVGGAFYVLMPYVAYYNPQYRLAYAETSATFILPLVFLAIDAGYGAFFKTIILTSLAVFLLVLFHFPSIVIVGGLSVLYGACLAGSWRAAVYQVKAVASGVLLGLMLAAFDVVPALTLLNEISASALQTFGWSGFFLLRFHDFTNPYYLILDACLLLPLITVWGTRHQWRIQPDAHAMAAVFFVSVLLTVPLSWIVWKIGFPLQRIQFPWRFLLPVSLMAAGLCAHALRFASTQSVRRSTFLVILAASLSSGISFYVADRVHSAAERSQAALQAPFVDAPEYMPAAAAAKGWLYFHQKGGNSNDRAASLVSPCLDLQAHPMQRTAQGMAFDISGCTGPTVLPQFYFPGWLADAGGTREVTPDQGSGLISVDIPSGSKELVIRRGVLPQEAWGGRISMLAWVIWAGCVLAVWRQKKRPSRVV